MNQCNICGGTEFVPGPNGRMNGNQPPWCTGCGSLERHRIIRTAYDTMKRYLPFGEMTALQFSKDKSIPASDFATFYISVFDSDDALDIQQLALPDNAVDMVICNHVLEHVQRDADALGELMRITTQHGILLLTVPINLSQEKTDDWGYPDWDIHGHYRLYGVDLADLFAQALPGVNVLQVMEQDAVTSGKDILFLLSRGPLLGPLAKAFDTALYTHTGAPELPQWLRTARL